MGGSDFFRASNEMAKMGVGLGHAVASGKIKAAIHELEMVAMFPQSWSDTSLGFGGLAGQAFTTAFTAVFADRKNAQFHVFIGGRYAYQAPEWNERFKADLREMKLRGKVESAIYRKANP